MAFIVLYPAVAMLAMFVLMVIMLILKFGSRWCRLRHHTFAQADEWNEEVYEHKVSYA